jgi:predicted glycoside hydrolase/deacetylase ChbG (UPF0249 family)
VNEGILECHRKGVVTSTTCLVNLKRSQETFDALRNTPSLDVGLHLNLTWGDPLLRGGVPTLAPGGTFRSKRGLLVALALGRVSPKEIADEAEAQIQLLKEAVGTPSHMDVHQHFQGFRVVWDAILPLAQRYGIGFLRRPFDPTAKSLAHRSLSRLCRKLEVTPPLRRTDHFRGLALTGKLRLDRVQSLLSELPIGLTELMVHPGQAEPASSLKDRLQKTRQIEMETLLAPEFSLALKKQQIALVNFRKVLEGNAGSKG